MTFAQAKALYLLLLLIPFSILAILSHRRRKQQLRSFLSPAAEQVHAVRSGREIDFFKFLLLGLALACFILALARPQWGEHYITTDVRGLKIVYLLDTSNSMSAEDLQPNRLEVAKALMVQIIDSLKTDMICLINFAATAYMQCPLTMDYEAGKLLTQASAISPAEEQGTDFGPAFTLALRTWKNSPQGQKIVILITDGEDQENRWAEQIAALKKQEIAVFTVGIGAASGAPIPIRDKNGIIVDWKKDHQGNMVRTRLDENTLLQIAAQTGGQYFRLSDSSGVRIFIDMLQRFQRQWVAQKIQRKKIERFYYPLLFGIILLACEMALSERKIRWRKK